MKKLLFSLAVFFAAQMAFAEDVTATYMQNYTAPFATTGEKLIGDNERWQKLSHWTTENDVTDAATGNITGWHVDFQKFPHYAYPGDDVTYPSGDARKGAIALTPGWDGFAGTVTNCKVYQTIKLPAGSYEITAQRAQDWGGAAGAYFVVNKGVGIPNIENIETAFKSTVFSTAAAPDWLLSVNFKLEEETELSIGLVASYTSVQTCVTISQFVIKKTEGPVWTNLKSAVAAAKTYAASRFPLGTIRGTYPPEKWNALQSAITAGEAMIAEASTTIEQAAIDAKETEIRTAMTDLEVGMIPPFNVSTDTKEYWYQIHDKRAVRNYWRVDSYENVEPPISYALALIASSEIDETAEGQKFKFVKAPAPAKGYHICCHMSPDKPLSIDMVNHRVVLDDGQLGLSPASWVFGASVYSNAFIVFTEGNRAKQLNSEVKKVPNYFGFYNPGTGNDDGNDMVFVPLLEAGAVNYALIDSLTGVAVRMLPAKYPIGTAEGQYAQAEWNVFVAARDQAVALVNARTANQADTDNMFNQLNTAINALKATKQPVFFASEGDKEHWYLVRDKRSPSSYWKIGDFPGGEGAEPIQGRLIMVKGKPTTQSDSILFKLVKAGDTGFYHIYSKLNATTPLQADTLLNVIGLTDTIPQAQWYRWELKTSTNPLYSVISVAEGRAKDQINSYSGYAPPYIAFYEGGTGDDGNNWTFVNVNTFFSGTKTVIKDNIDVYVSNRRIVSRNVNDKLIVYNMYGQRVSAENQLTNGVYIVQIEGKNGSKKVLVK